MDYHKLPIQTYWEDSDAGGIVYYANYLKFYERGRTELLREAGVHQDALSKEQGLIFVVRKVETEYKKAIQFNEKIIVQTKIERIRGPKIEFEQKITGTNDDSDIRSTAKILVACIDLEKSSPVRTPDQIIEQCKKWIQPS